MGSLATSRKSGLIAACKIRSDTTVELLRQVVLRFQEYANIYEVELYASNGFSEGMQTSSMKL